jgi:hypothetical protein
LLDPDVPVKLSDPALSEIVGAGRFVAAFTVK